LELIGKIKGFENKSIQPKIDIFGKIGLKSDTHPQGKGKGKERRKEKKRREK